METKYNIKEEMDVISEYYGFLPKEKIEQKAIEALYNKHLELIKRTLRKDMSKPLTIDLKIDKGFVISTIS